MKDEIKEIIDYYKKDTKEKWEWLQSINFKYGDEKYIQRIKNHKLLLDYITNLQEEVEDLREDSYAYHQLMKMQNKREYRSKFLKEFQEEFGTNVFPDYDEIYKRYDKVKKENEKLKELCDKYEEEHSTTFNEWKETITDKYQTLKNLQKENERLKNRNEFLEKVCVGFDDKYENYKSRNEKAKSLTNRTIEIIKQQPSGNDEWILERLNGINYCLGGDEE